jgi:hypothetical protein
MRKIIIVPAVFALALLTSLLVGVQAVEAQYTSDGQGFPLVSAISIISPSNSTYSSGLLTLNVTVKSFLNPNTSNVTLVYCIDGKTNTTIRTESTPVPIEVETTDANGTARAPIISNLSLENKTYSQNDLPLNFTTDEPTSWMGYCLDGKTNVTVAGNATLAGLSEGSHSVTIYSNDTAGNVDASETVTFTVDTPEPFPTTQVATASMASVAIVGLSLLVYFKKCKHQAVSR